MMKYNYKLMLAIAFFHLTGCQKSQPPKTVSVQSYQEHSQFKGKIEAYSQSPYSSPISGIVSEVYHQPGEYVEKDTPIFKVKSDQAQQTLLTQLSKRHHTESKYQQTKRQESVYKDLLNEGAISQNEFLEISNRRHAYEFEMVEIRHQLDKICPLLEDDLCNQPLSEIEKHLPLVIIIKSEDSGILHKSQKENPFAIGQLIKQNEPLFVLAHTERIHVEFAIEDHESGLFTPGSQVKIKIQRPNQTLLGTVENIQPSSEKNTAEQFIVHVRSETISEPKSIRIGSMANIELPSQHDYLLIPHKAIFSEKPQSYFVEKILNNKETKKIAIKIIQSMGWYSIITGELEPNDQLLYYDQS
jgi:multidrug efflux pump subunit AcrA (membrane-fusion protein)